MNEAAARRIHFGSGAKYNNRKTIDADGIRHDSIKESKCWRDLLTLQNAGRIRNLERRVVFLIKAPSGSVICRYISDFTYEEYDKGEWNPIVHDAKGFKTPVYRLKKKLMRLMLGIEIRET